jgi:hypothetical protein
LRVALAASAAAFLEVSAKSGFPKRSVSMKSTQKFFAIFSANFADVVE